MAKRQGKLTLFLTSSGGVAERELIDEECAADLQPATKRTIMHLSIVSPTPPPGARWGNGWGLYITNGDFPLHVGATS